MSGGDWYERKPPPFPQRWWRRNYALQMPTDEQLADRLRFDVLMGLRPGETEAEGTTRITAEEDQQIEVWTDYRRTLIRAIDARFEMLGVLPTDRLRLLYIAPQDFTKAELADALGQVSDVGGADV